MESSAGSRFVHLGLFFVWIRIVSSLHVTFVTFGFDSGYGRVSSTRHTASGLHVALREFQETKAYAHLNITCEHIILEVPNTFECTESAPEFDRVSRFYYSRKWDSDHVLTLITPGCGDSVVLGGLAREWDVTVITTATMYQETRNRLNYPTLVTVTPLQAGLIGETIFALLRQYNWTSVAQIYDTASLPSYFTLAETLKAVNVRQGSPLRLGSYPIQSTKNFSALSLLRTVRTYTRVIVLSMHVREIRKFLIAAHRLNMTNGEYVYLVSESTPSFVVGNLTWQEFDGHDDDMFRAYRVLLQVVPCKRPYVAESQHILEDIADVSRVIYKVTYLPGDPQPSEVEVAAYQAFSIYIKVLHEIRQISSSHVSGAAVAERMLNRSFDTAFGDLYVDEAGQRRSRQCVNDLNVTTGLFTKVVYYEPISRQLRDIPGLGVDWGTPDGLAPLNEPPCGFLGLAPACERGGAATRTVIAVPCTVMALAAVIFIIAWHVSNEVALRGSRWILDPADLAVVHEDIRSKLSRGLSQKSDRSMLRKKPTHLYQKLPVTVASYAMLQGNNPLLHRHVKRLLLQMSLINHNNIVHFIGVYFAQHTLCIVSRFGPRGSLRRFLGQSPSATDWDLRCSLISDCLEGVRYIHGCPLGRHGNITSANCRIDSRFTLLIGELGYADVVNGTGRSFGSPGTKTLRGLLQRRPARDANSTEPEQPDDILAVGLLMQEVLIAFRCAETVSPTLYEAAHKDLKPLVTLCCGEDAKQRPTIRRVQQEYRSLCQLTSDGFMANLLQRLQIYAMQLDGQVHDRTVALRKERAICDDLLREVLPRWVLDRLSTGLQVAPEAFHSTTIFFSHVSGFLQFVANHQPLEIFAFVSNMFLQFDGVVSEFLVFKVETVEDTYLVVSGIYSTTVHHTAEICLMALALHAAFETVKGGLALEFMAGIHSGPCVAGVVGRKTPRYCLFGDSVNVASRMCSHSEPSRIQVSVNSADHLKNDGRFFLKPRGLTALKGRGELRTFWLYPSL